MSVAAIVLAAGAGQRMGGAAKALLTLDGRTFLAAIAETARAAGVSSVVAVLGPPHGPAVRARLPVGVGVAWNPDPARGMLSSVQAAIAQLPGTVQAALVWPVDTPRVAVSTVRRLLAAPAGRIAVPRHDGRGGHPIRLPRALFAALAALPADATLRQLLDAERARVVPVEVDDAAIARDIDTPEDYERERVHALLSEPALDAATAEPTLAAGPAKAAAKRKR